MVNNTVGWIGSLVRAIEVPDPAAPAEMTTTLSEILSWARYGTLFAGALAILISGIMWGFAANSSNPQRVALAKGGLLVGALVTFIGLSINALLAMVPEI